MSQTNYMVLIPIWGRMKITELCLKNWVELKKTESIDVICIVSEQWAKLLCFKLGLKYIEASNDDLGEKMNIGVKNASKFKFKYLMNMGSDDIVSSDLFRLYEDYQDRAIFGLTKITFFDSVDKKAVSVDYKNMVGAGRCIRKDFLTRALEKGNLYDSGLKRGLDNNSRAKFYDVSMTEIDNDPKLLIDIKGQDNIWKFTDLEELGIKGEEVELESLGLKDEILTELIEL